MLLCSFASCADTPEETSEIAESTTESILITTETTEAFVETEKVTESEAASTAAEEITTVETEEAETEAFTEAVTTSEATETTTETETLTETETEEKETVMVSDLVSFVDYTASSRSYYDLLDGDIAMSFTVPDGYIKTLYLNLTDSNSYTECSVDVSIYVMENRYDTAVESMPIYNEYITSTLRTYTIEFEEGQIGAGKYLLVVSYVDIDEAEDVRAEAEGEPTGTEAATDETETGFDSCETEVTPPVEPDPEPKPERYTKVIRDRCWLPKTTPDEYVQYGIKTYINGKQDKKIALCGGIVIVHSAEAPDEETVKNEEKAEGDNVAKVILLGGQSNATGATSNAYLKNNLTDEEYQKYVNGFSNVKILYVNGTTSGGFKITTTTDSFVDTKIGQGYSTATFGPELGLAAYLSEAFPDETFYIIKYAIGGSGLYAHWNPNDVDRRICIEQFHDTVEKGLEILEDVGLDPQIVAFLWMQGESDASTMYRAHEYYALQKALVEEIRDTYAFYAPLDDIAFIDAAISDSGFWATYFMVNECKRLYSLESDKNFYIDTNYYGLTTLYENNDLAHYDSLSMLLLGQLYGEVIAEIVK